MFVNRERGNFMKDYYVGLDIGTNSVGWAVTDKDYLIPKFKGNAMWGIRLLEESNTADERRAFRSQRRRNDRNKFRIDCLQMLFDEEISKVDVSFFQRLADSNLYQEDKNVDGKYSVFNDKDFTDKDYHKKYPTIYHLRKELIENTAPHDVRLVYLAVSHILKNRGHFLFDSENLGKNGLPVFDDVWNELSSTAEEYFENFDLRVDDTEKLSEILKRKTTITLKKNELMSLYNIKDDSLTSILTLLAGGKVQIAKLFDDELLKDSETKSITFSNGFDEKAVEYESVLGNRFELVERIKAVYDWSVLADILEGERFLSFAKCKCYEKHKTDLKLLKDYIKKYETEKYNLIFNQSKKSLNNYVAYSGHGGKKVVEYRCTNQQDFCDFLKKHLVESDDEKYAQMFDDINFGVFMPKAVSKDNSVIPMQVNRTELEVILKNASLYLDFLNDIDNDGKTVMQKIIDIFNFRIPYYVGPLNKHSKNAWLVRKEGKIYPWNFNEIVDIDNSAEEFIKNLTSKCTYLKTEDVLPKSSLVYSEFMVLNELNNLKVDGNEIPVEVKQNIFNDLFKHKGKVTQKALKNYLKSIYGEDFKISGIDGDFKSNLKSYMDFNDYNLSDDEKEEIIKAITIFGDDKKLLKRRIEKLYSSKLTSGEIKKICKLKYSDWGRLSNEFINGIVGTNKENGETCTILEFMRNTNNNLMQLLSNNYTFLDIIEKQNEGEFSTLKNEIESLYISPKIKRPVYQSMLIVEELVKIQKQEPKKIFIEVTRGEKAKQRTVSRKAKLLELYASCKKDYPELFSQIQSYNDNDFRRDALYLYYTQFGRCMYTNTKLDISDLSNCDIDHIFPQSKIKDDSIDNRVLVLKTENEKKGNVYPIAQSIRDNMSDFWKMLYSKKLIGEKKYQRLIRNKALSDDELSGFINRQLVETGQSVKAIGELLKKRYPNTKIVYVKANLVSDFRQKYKMLKCREVNDLHHAKDAYLNVVVGNVYDTKFTSRFFIDELQTGKSSLNKMFDYSVKGAWDAENNNSLKRVMAVMSKNNIRFTRYSFKQKGGLFDQNILKKGKGQVPIKKNSPRADIDKYGGYNKAKSTCFALIEYSNAKGKKIRTFYAVNLYEEKEYFTNPESFLLDRIEEAVKVRIIIPCVKYNALISVDGFRMHISGKTGNQIICKPAMQLVLGYKSEHYCKQISNYLNKCKELKREKEVTPRDNISCDENIELYDTIIDKLSDTIFNVKFNKLATDLKNNKETFESLSIYNQCVVISQILGILHADARKGDLTLINLSKQSGTLHLSQKISANISIKLINQSTTGLFEKEIDLLK